MAKEQWHNWGRYIFLGIMIIFAGGGWIVTVKGNTDDIGVLQVDTKTLREDVHKLEKSDIKITGIAENTLNILTQVNASLQTIQKEQTKQAIIQAENAIKLSTLTKDD